VNSAKQQIDLRGLSCPEPVIRTKKLFDNPSVEVVEALVDDEVCVNNLQRLSRTLKAGCTVNENDGYYTVVVERTANASEPKHDHPAVRTAAATTANVGSSVGTVVFLGSDQLGTGDPDFSRTLMNVFLQTTMESGLRPRAILLINTGVRLLARDAQTLKVLNDFRAAGCEVLACGLCVDYYKLKDDVPKEQITNMFAICEYLFAADRIVQP
jgi:selenium metabolism protein YedF